MILAAFLILGWLLAIIGWLGFFGAEDQVQRERERTDKAEQRATKAQRQADNWSAAYHTKVREQATLLALIDGDTETPVNHQLRAEMGLRHLPLHDAISQRMAAQIDAEWLELDLSEGER